MGQAIARAAGAMPSTTPPAGAAPRLVGEFQGYIDGLVPSVRWADRKNMPEVGTKLYALPAGAEPRTWSILLTSENHGTVGPNGCTFPWAGEKHERVQVVEVVAAGAPPAPGVDLAGLVRLDVAATNTAGAVPEGDALDTIAAQAARAVGGIFTDAIPIKSLVVYARAVLVAAAPSAPALAEPLRVAVREMTAALEDREWAEHVSTDPDAAALERQITELVGLHASANAAAQAARNAAQSWKAIGPLPVERDKDGWWSHPAIPNFNEDFGAYKGWLAAVGLEVTYKTLESEDEDHPAYVAYFENEEGSSSAWEPAPPDGEGWFTWSIHDTEDGPAWVWARRSNQEKGGA